MWAISLAPMALTVALLAGQGPHWTVPILFTASIVFFVYAPKATCSIYRDFLKEEPGTLAVLKARTVDDSWYPTLFLEEFFPDTLKVSWFGIVSYETRTEVDGYDITMRTVC